MTLIEKAKAFLKSDTCKKFIKFAITGVINTLVDFAVYSLVRRLTQNEYIAQTAGYFCGIVNSYIINRSWTFRKEKAGFFSSQLVKFLVVNGITFGLSMGATWLFNDFMQLHWIIAKLLVVAITTVVNFTLSNLWAFRKK